ncbi:MAG: hypothetical protein AB7K09_20535 [Planctomycetota bacterium]
MAAERLPTLHARAGRARAVSVTTLAALLAWLTTWPVAGSGVAVAQPAPDNTASAPPSGDAVAQEIAAIGQRLDEPDIAHWYELEHRMLQLRHRPELRTLLRTAEARNDAVASRRARQLLALLDRPVDAQLDRELPSLVPNLFSSDRDRRLVACEMLWRHRSPAAARALIDRLQDDREDHELRVHAALALAVQVITPELIAVLDATTTLLDSRLAIAALDALDEIDRRLAPLRGPATDAAAKVLAPVAAALRVPPVAGRVTAGHAVRIARTWQRAAEVWRREHAWRVLARHPHELVFADMFHRLLHEQEPDARVRAVMWRSLELCTDRPTAFADRLAMLNQAASRLPEEPGETRTALKSFIHHCAEPPLLARLVTDGRLSDEIVAALPHSAREAAAWYEPVAFERFVQHKETALARDSRRCVVRIGGGAALLSRLTIGDEPLGRPGDDLRDLLRRMSSRLGINVVVAPQYPLLDAAPLTGVVRGGTAWDALATIGEMYRLRFAFEGDRLVLYDAALHAAGERWLPRRAVPAALLDRFNLLMQDAPADAGPKGKGHGDRLPAGARATLGELLRHCAAVLGAPVVCTPRLASTFGMSTRLGTLPPGRPLATALPQALEPHGLLATFRGAALWIGSGDELAAWAAIDRFRNRPEPLELERLGQNAVLNTRPVVAECLALEDPPADSDARAAWVNVAMAELDREASRDGGPRDARVAMMLRALAPRLDDPRVVDFAVQRLGVTDSLTRDAARDALMRYSPDLLWSQVAPRLPTLTQPGQRALAHILAASATPLRLQHLLDSLMAREDLIDADERVLRLRSLRLSLSQVALALLPSRSPDALPAAAPLRFELDNASPAFFFYGIGISTGGRITPGVIVRDWWARLDPYVGAQLGATSQNPDWRYELPRALRAVDLGVGGHTPLPLQAHWYPGISADDRARGAPDWAPELMLETPGARGELALFDALLERVARGGGDSVRRRRAVALFAFWLSAMPTVERVLVDASRKPLENELAGVLPDERVPSADRVVWQRISTWLTLIETRDASPPDDAIARIGIRLHHIAATPLPDWYAGYRERDAADPWWANPHPPDDDATDGAGRDR